MSSDFFKHLGKKRKFDRKNYKYTRIESNYEEIHGQDATEDEIFSSEVYPLKERKKEHFQPMSKSMHYVEHQIKDGDSLQKLSLIYRCPVAELKRVNRLFSNQEFYALKKVRIPVKNYSILTEILPTAECSNGNSGIDGQAIRTFHIGIGKVLNGEERTEAAAFLKKMDEDLVRIRESTKLYKDSLEEVTETLTSPQFKPLVDKTKEECNGADCGLQWKTLIVIIIVLILVLPIVIILYVQISKISHPETSELTKN